MSNFPERLKSARMMNGYSLQELADKLENRLTKQALSKYELGQVYPDGEKLAWLCEALNVRPDYFTREVEVQLQDIEFRKLKRFPVKQKDKIIEQTRDALARYYELESVLGLDNEADFETKKIKSNADVENVVKELRNNWKLGTDPVFNVLELLEDHHIKVVEVDADMDFSGLSTWVNEKYPVVVLNANLDGALDRKRFTALHELAHLVLDLSEYEEKVREKYCNYFAGAFLFPKEIMEAELGKSRHRLDVYELGLLKKQYGMSVFAMVYRAKDLEIISESYFKQLVFLLAQWGFKKEEPLKYKYEGYEKSNRFHQLLLRALAEELISSSKAAALNNQKLAEFCRDFLSVGS